MHPARIGVMGTRMGVEHVTLWGQPRSKMSEHQCVVVVIANVGSRLDGRTLAPHDRALDDMDLPIEQRDGDAWVGADERFT